MVATRFVKMNRVVEQGYKIEFSYIFINRFPLPWPDKPNNKTSNLLSGKMRRWGCQKMLM
jgi:hypothetical protein